MRRIHHHTARNSGQTETEDAPVVRGRAASAGFPAVHPFTEIGILAFDEDRLRGLEQVFLGSEKFVVGEQDGAAQALGRQVHQFGEMHQGFSIAPLGADAKRPRS